MDFKQEALLQEGGPLDRLAPLNVFLYLGIVGQCRKGKLKPIFANYKIEHTFLLKQIHRFTENIVFLEK